MGDKTFYWDGLIIINNNSNIKNNNTVEPLLGTGHYLEGGGLVQIGGGSSIFVQGQKGGPYKFMQVFNGSSMRKISFNISELMERL